jgi:NAD+ synthetase
LLVTLNGSPFVLGKFERHIDLLQGIARDHRVPVVSVNQVGGNDDLIFDGRSVILDETGAIGDAVPGWIQATHTFTVSATSSRPPLIGTGNGAPRVELLPVDPLADLFHALALGVRDYCRKTGHRQALIGLSGGIDSALTAAIAVAALGPRNVTGLIMPSQYSSARSHADALALVNNLGMKDCRELSIEQLHESARSTLAPSLHDRIEGVTDENLQSRLRGLLLMAHANALDAFVLATGNKSELATGYCTLYGDMCGALAVLGDVLKTTIYDLANWLDANHAACGFARPPIPKESITRVPTAELRPNQTDQDTLPPYDVLDQIIQRFIELEQSPQWIVTESGFDHTLVQRWCRIIDQQQYKRDQAAIVLKVSPRSFGRGRPMPAASKVTAWPAAIAETRAAVRNTTPSSLKVGM